MRQHVYRWLIAILGVWGLLYLPSLLAPVFAVIQPSDVRGENWFALIVPAIGFALLPIAVVGLWRFRLWGFICLVLGLLLVVVAQPQSVFLHAACLAVTLVRYFFPR